jgi:hypothetical protein
LKSSAQVRVSFSEIWDKIVKRGVSSIRHAGAQVAEPPARNKAANNHPALKNQCLRVSIARASLAVKNEASRNPRWWLGDERAQNLFLTNVALKSWIILNANKPASMQAASSRRPRSCKGRAGGT